MENIVKIEQTELMQMLQCALADLRRSNKHDSVFGKKISDVYLALNRGAKAEVVPSSFTFEKTV